MRAYRRRGEMVEIEVRKGPQRWCCGMCREEGRRLLTERREAKVKAYRARYQKARSAKRRAKGQCQYGGCKRRGRLVPDTYQHVPGQRFGYCAEHGEQQRRYSQAWYARRRAGAVKGGG